MRCKVCNREITKTDSGLHLCDECVTPTDMLAGQQLLNSLEEHDRGMRRGGQPLDQHYRHGTWARGKG